MKYIAKEQCFFDTGTECFLVSQPCGMAKYGLGNFKGQWTMHLMGQKEGDRKTIEAICSFNEFSILPDGEKE